MNLYLFFFVFVCLIKQRSYYTFLIVNLYNYNHLLKFNLKWIIWCKIECSTLWKTGRSGLPTTVCGFVYATRCCGGVSNNYSLTMSILAPTGLANTGYRRFYSGPPGLLTTSRTQLKLEFIDFVCCVARQKTNKKNLCHTSLQQLKALSL